MTEQDRRRFLKSMGVAAVGAGALTTAATASSSPGDRSVADGELPNLNAMAKMMTETPSEEVFDERNGP